MMTLKLVFLLIIVQQRVNALGKEPVFGNQWWAKCEAGLRYSAGNDPGKVYATVKLDDVTAFDFDGNPLTCQCFDQSGKPCNYEFGKKQQFKFGDTIFTMKAIDKSGRSVSCGVTVTVADNEPPKFSNSQCKTGFRYEESTLPGKAYATVKFDDVKVSDNDGLPTTITCLERFKGDKFQSCKYEFGKEYQFKIGTTEVHIIATDKSGGSASCIFFVTVEDGEPPKFQYRGKQIPDGMVYIKDLQPGKGYGMVKIVDIKVSDNTGVSPHVVCNQGQYEFNKEYKFKAGKMKLKYTATDTTGLSADIHYFVVVNAFCPPLVKAKDKYISVVNGSKSITEKQEVGSFHKLQCAPGFRINHELYQCMENGRWSPSEPPSCTDFQPPKFSKEKECEGIIKYTKNTLPGKSYATIKLDGIKISENSGIAPKVQCLLRQKNGSCNYELGKEYKFDIGKVNFKIKATDHAGLQSYCYFNVQVKDVEPPKLIKCPSNITKEAHTKFVRVNWDSPSYSDNSNQIINILPNRWPGTQFLVPSTAEITYQALDTSHNVNKECKFTVQTKRSKAECSTPTPPNNGAVAFTKDLAVVVCRTGYDITIPLPFVSCQKKKWTANFSDIKCKAGGSNPLMSFSGDCNTDKGKKDVLRAVNLLLNGAFKNDTAVLCGQRI